MLPPPDGLRAYSFKPISGLSLYHNEMMPYEITATEVAALLEDSRQKVAAGAKPDFILLDVREPYEVAVARVEGARTIPLGEISSRLTEIDPECHIVTMCHAGVRSMNVALFLRDHDYDRVQSMRGGIDAWSTEVDPTVPRY